MVMTLAINTAIKPRWRISVRTGTMAALCSWAFGFGAGRMAAAVTSDANEIKKPIAYNRPVGGSQPAPALLWIHGGGTVMVPVLYEVFSLYGVPDDVLMPLCVGTSLAVIVPTSISSFIGHYRKGAVDIDVLKVWALPITAGVLCGILTASVARPRASR